MTIGEKIKALRKEIGLTQTELGAKLGVQKNAVSKWECGRVDDIPSSKIKAMAQLFGVNASYLIDEDAKNEPLKVTGDLNVDEANKFFNYLLSLGYYVRYDDEKIIWHIISQDREIDISLTPEEFKRMARTSNDMIKVLLESKRTKDSE